jgi:hypothetical protein
LRQHRTQAAPLGAAPLLSCGVASLHSSVSDLAVSHSRVTSRPLILLQPVNPSRLVACVAKSSGSWPHGSRVTGLAGRPAAAPCRPVHRLDIIQPPWRSCRSPNESNHAAGPSRTDIGRRLTAKRAASQRSARGHCTHRASSACAAVRVTTSGVCQNGGRRVLRICKEARPPSAAVSTVSIPQLRSPLPPAFALYDRTAVALPTIAPL